MTMLEGPAPSGPRSLSGKMRDEGVPSPILCRRRAPPVPFKNRIFIKVIHAPGRHCRERNIELGEFEPDRLDMDCGPRGHFHKHEFRIHQRLQPF